MGFGNIIWLVLLGGAFFFMMNRGGGCCGGHDHGQHGGHDGHSPLPGNGSAQMTDFSAGNRPLASAESVIDPVCGMPIRTDLPAFHSTHWGRTFLFCSERCRNLFELNPGQYTGETPQPVQPPLLNGRPRA